MIRNGLTPELLLSAYASGVFPMAESRDNPELFWVDPELRGIIPLDGFHISRSLGRKLRSSCARATHNTAFARVIDCCADREETWINAPIRTLSLQLHRAGFAHSIEVWEDGALAGGVYGISLGGAFFGESMFSTRRDGSKLALAALVDQLTQGGFSLLDVQFLTPHLASLGAIEIPRTAYRKRLSDALERPACFPETTEIDLAQVWQRRTQTS